MTSYVVIKYPKKIPEIRYLNVRWLGVVKTEQSRIRVAQNTIWELPRNIVYLIVIYNIISSAKIGIQANV